MNVPVLCFVFRLMMVQWAETCRRIFNIITNICCIYWLNKLLYYCKTQRDGCYQNTDFGFEIRNKKLKIKFWPRHEKKMKGGRDPLVLKFGGMCERGQLHVTFVITSGGGAAWCPVRIDCLMAGLHVSRKCPLPLPRFEQRFLGPPSCVPDLQWLQD